MKNSVSFVLISLLLSYARCQGVDIYNERFTYDQINDQFHTDLDFTYDQNDLFRKRTKS